MKSETGKTPSVDDVLELINQLDATDDDRKAKDLNRRIDEAIETRKRSGARRKLTRERSGQTRRP